MNPRDDKSLALLKACRDAMVEAADGPTDWSYMIAELDAALETTPSHAGQKYATPPFSEADRIRQQGPQVVSPPSTTPQKSDAAKREHWRQWAIDGMPADKMRLAEATWEAAASALSATACSDRDKILCDAVADAARWHALKELAGYYQDGSQTTVKLYQDDALRSCFIEAGNKTYGTDGSTFDSAIDEYINRADGGKQTDG